MARKVMAAALGVLAMGGAAWGQAPAAFDGPLQGLERGRGGFAERFFAQFDLNHDGKVTHDELNRADGAKFASVAHEAGTIDAEQFTRTDVQNIQQHVAQMFRRLDWNGDGRLSLDEYAGPQRVRFEMFDRDGKGTESCTSPPAVQHAAFRPHANFGRARFCAENDLNKDGSVSHAEFDSATAKHFAAATANAKAMTPAQFAADVTAHYRDSSARYFQRLDGDRDGRLSLKEFAASDQKTFARLDRNKDGTVTRDEISYRRSGFQKRG